MQQTKQLPIILEQNQQLSSTQAKHTEPISILKTPKKKTLPFMKLPIQLLQTIKKPNRALKDIYLSYSKN